MTSRQTRRLRLTVTAGLIAVVLGAGVALVAGRARRSGNPVDGTAALPSGAGRPDVVLITIDTLRADAPGFAGNAKVQTPTLDRLAKQGRVFDDAHAQNVVTLPSHVNILTGLYPYQHGVRENSGFRLSDRVATLATLLKERGYATGAFVGAFPLDGRFGLGRGFDVYDDRYPKEKSVLEFEMPERPATEVVAAASKWLAETGGAPRFLWVHVYDCHAPYRPPPPWAERYAGEPYFGELAAVDAALEPLLAPFLEGRARPTLIVLTADHGEALGQHEEETHSLFAYEETLKIPLVVWFPGRIAPGTDPRLARHVDIAPTVAKMAGVAPAPDWPGSSLAEPPPPAERQASYFEAFSAAYNYGWAPLRGVIAEGHKLIDLPIPELYDLEADPSERDNLASKKPDAFRRLRAKIPPESAIDAAARSRPDAEEAANLRSLGYLAGGGPVKAAYTAADDPKRLVSLDREMHRYVELYQGGDLGGATALARRVVSERPSMFLPYVHLAFLLRRGGQTAAALEVYRAAVSRGVANEELVTHYALALCEAGRPEDAIRALHPYADSPEPNTQNAVGIAWADAGKTAEAERAFAAALRRDPRNLEAHENLGIVRLRAEDLTGAGESFRRALAIDERSSRAWNGLGVSQARLGDERGAVESWSRAVGIDPTMYDALFNLGLAAAKVGLRDQARSALERFVSAAPPSRYRADIEKARGILKTLRAEGSG